MNVQFVDGLEFRGEKSIRGQKDPSKIYKRIIFEDLDGNRMVFFDDVERLPAGLPAFERGKFYLLTADIISGNNGFSCHLLGAQAAPEFLDS